MLLDLNLIERLLNGIEINGALHIGAHECEELLFYINNLNVIPEKIIWIEAMENKVAELKMRKIPNVYNAVITDKDDDVIVFNVANNGESSSVLDFETHAIQHPNVMFVDKIEKTTITVDTFFEKNSLDASKCHFWNIDIQGAELMALRGSKKSIQYAKAIYLEVNKEELYKGCGLIGDIDLLLTEEGFVRVSMVFTKHGWGDALYIHSKYINDTIRKYIECTEIKTSPANKLKFEYIFYGYFKKGLKTIFDVGSQENSIYRDFEGEVHYFEPVTKLLEILKRSYNRNTKSIFNNFMLSNKRCGDFTKKYETISSSREIGKNYMNKHKISTIQLLKIDDCIHLMDIIKGFEELMKDVRIIQFNWFDNDTIKLINVLEYLNVIFGFTNFAYLSENGPEQIVNINKLTFEYCTIVAINPNVE